MSLTALAATLSNPAQSNSIWQTLLWQRSAIAHQLELAEDVGATLHIEPNDTPRAGEEVLAWFALARKGGAIIPLSSCDCAIAIYAQADPAKPIATPTPQAVDSEGYQGIPGAMVTFPDVGAYTLVISGSPKAEQDFSPFELAFDVTVAARARAQNRAEVSNDEANSPESTKSTDETSEASAETIPDIPAESITESLPDPDSLAATPTIEESTGETGKLIGIGVVGAGILGAIALKLKQR